MSSPNISREIDEAPELRTYVNGRILPHTEALAEMSEASFHSPSGFYDAERTFGGKIFKLREHLERLYRSLEEAPFEVGLSLDEMEAATLKVLDANRSLLQTDDDFILGQMVSPKNDESGKANSAIYCQFIDFASFAHSYAMGVRLVTPNTYAVPERVSAPGDNEQTQETYSLLADENGYVTACRHENFLFIRDGKIKLPDREKTLPGLSMETAIELAGQLGISVDEGYYTTAEVYPAEEAIISGTRFCMLPVATINGVALGDGVPGRLTGRLMEAWSEKVGLDFVQQALSHEHTHPPEDESFEQPPAQ